MRCLYASPLALAVVQVAAAFSHAPVECTLRPSGGDDAPAFLHAARHCSRVLIPEHSTLNISTRMNMTALKNTHISLQGTVKFNPDIDYWSGNGFFIPFQSQITYWLLGGKNIRLDGGGTIDGSGQVYWDAFTKNSSLLRPITLTLFQATNAIVENISMLDSPEWFNLCNECKEVIYNNVNISAISMSSAFIANTDGWDIYRSDQVTIENSFINNGDDCVSFKPNSTNILVSNLHCNGSHGISVGSLGQTAGEFDIVENVTSTTIHISNAQNGARIKAFAGPNVGSGIVKNITFEKFVETNVDNPIVIDQCYMTNVTECTAFPSNTYIEDIDFLFFSGTSSGNEGSVVASLECSPGGRCSNIAINNVYLTPPGDGPGTYTCQNVVLSGDDAQEFGNCTTTS